MKLITSLVAAGVIMAGGIAVAAPNVAPFYQQTAEIKPSGPLGTIVKREQIATPIPGAVAYRIAYISSDVNNRPTIATGLVIAPKAAGTNRPVIAWAHGTTGTAQNNGPSQELNPAVPLNEYFLIGGNSATDYGVPAVDKFIQAGYVVVATDYQGLGGGGRHEYAVAVTNGRDVINSVRAVSSARMGGAGTTSVAIGWSQGGGAILGMASDKDYIDQKGTAQDGVVFKGFVGLAPDDVAAVLPTGTIDQATADKIMVGLTKQFSVDMLNFAHYVMTLWGTQNAYPDQLRLTDVLTPEGAQVIEEILSNKGIHAAADTISFNYGANFKSLLKPTPTNTIAWVQAFRAGSVAPVNPVAPVAIYYGTRDTAVPPVMGELYQKQKCSTGAQVERTQLPGEQSHFTTPGSAEPYFVPWIQDRLANKPLSNPCITVVK